MHVFKGCVVVVVVVVVPEPILILSFQQDHDQLRNKWHQRYDVIWHGTTPQ